MKLAATLLLLLAAISFSGCWTAHPVSRPADPVSRSPGNARSLPPLAPSPRLIVGRVLAVDRAQRFAIVDLQADAPAPALAEGAELIARNPASLEATAALRASRYGRSHTLGTTIISGQPAPGDEVVWLAP